MIEVISSKNQNKKEWLLIEGAISSQNEKNEKESISNINS